MVVKNFIIRIFMGAHRRSITDPVIIGPAVKYAGRHIGMVPESTTTRIAGGLNFRPQAEKAKARQCFIEEAELYLDPQVIAEQIADTPLANNGYMNRLIKSLKSGGAFPHHQCYAGVMMARIDPWGNVYPCLEQHSRAGSIREKILRLSGILRY